MSNTNEIISSGAMWKDGSNTIFPRTERFTFFNTILKKPSWEDKKVLDIGGNRGNFLEDTKVYIDFDPKNYYSMDVDKAALEFGKENNPDANWIHHNAFNHMYNPSGEDNLAFPFESDFFDFVIAYSVYSHTTYEQMIFDMKEMLRVCKSGGKIAFTIVDQASVDFFCNKRIIDYPDLPCLKVEDFAHMFAYSYFVNNNLKFDHMYGKEHIDHLVTVYNLNWLTEQLDSYGFRYTIKFPTTGHVQRTIIIDKD